MEKYEINKYIDSFKSTLKDLEVSLNPAKLKENIESINEEINQEGFWLDQKKANKTIENLNNLKEKYNLYSSLEKGLNDVLEAKELAMIEDNDETNQLLEEVILDYEKKINEATISVILNGEYDNNNAILEIHPGAGGTESMDWAAMLLRMYQRFCQRNNFKFKIIDYLPGDEAGIKSVTVEIDGKYAYGFLKGERGVHRLVRISPFDSNKRRHTSFASVDVTPIVSDLKDVMINDNDLRIDTYLSSGHGGQGVNTTYSAVRITHLPTNIVVTCQNERSQIQNKEQALKVLKSKLLDIEIKKQEESLLALKGISMEIAFGSQIRSYVFHPYSMVKDHRFKLETSDVNGVMDGDILNFVYGYLKWMVKSDE